MEGFFIPTSSGCLGGDTRVFPTNTRVGFKHPNLFPFLYP
jgi:hypothetical protein